MSLKSKSSIQEYFDVHSHIHDRRYQQSIAEIIEDACNNGVRYIVNCSATQDQWSVVLESSASNNVLIPALGIHPWYLDSASKGWLESLELLVASNQVAIGEVGLDFSDQLFSREIQIDFLRKQLMLAKKYERPVCLHCRGAWQQLLALIDEAGRFPAGGLVHSYSGSGEIIRELEKRGFYISFSGSATNHNNKRVARAIKHVSMDRILIETDSPDITPHTVPGYSREMLNRPSNIGYVCKAIAESREMSMAEVAAACFENAERLFGRLMKDK